MNVGANWSHLYTENFPALDCSRRRMRVSSWSEPHYW